MLRCDGPYDLFRSRSASGRRRETILAKNHKLFTTYFQGRRRTAATPSERQKWRLFSAFHSPFHSPATSICRDGVPGPRTKYVRTRRRVGRSKQIRGSPSKEHYITVCVCFWRGYARSRSRFALTVCLLGCLSPLGLAHHARREDWR